MLNTKQKQLWPNTLSLCTIVQRSVMSLTVRLGWVFLVQGCTSDLCRRAPRWHAWLHRSPPPTSICPTPRAV